MDKDGILKLFQQAASGEITPEQAYKLLVRYPSENLGFACLDHHRSLRDNFPEVVFCQGKTIEQIIAIMVSLERENVNLLATRADAEVYRAVANIIPEVKYNELGRVIYLQRKKNLKSEKRALIISAGTADMPVAEETAACLQVMGAEIQKAYDIGVAGLHRIIDVLPCLEEAGVIIVVAGMEGALASVIAGLTSKPVIAVPTSVGYGASFNGLAALLSMLNSCASGIGVVNIDNGYGAAALAFSILVTKYG
ncbi:MAG: nickel pincer cofactor biosynthesis protein LarB [Syntrophomonadaceae bacterium]|jgi:NCAIR mutase (PurE)-related protein|nr:nickel pincer cofactor biosynthesis protein LarB [Syntrophomonadaceae bacterium]